MRHTYIARDLKLCDSITLPLQCVSILQGGVSTGWEAAVSQHGGGCGGGRCHGPRQDCVVVDSEPVYLSGIDACVSVCKCTGIKYLYKYI